MSRRSFPIFVLALALNSYTALARSQENLPTLIGEWTTDCLPIGKNGRHGQIMRVTIDDEEIAATSQIYAKSSCQTPTVQVNYVGDISSVAVEKEHIDFTHTVKKLTFTPNLGVVAEHYNANSESAGCGLTGWKANVAFSVAGRTCAPFSFAGEGVTLHERAWIDANKLRFGNFPSVWTARTAEDRPSKPAEIVFYRTGS